MIWLKRVKVIKFSFWLMLWGGLVTLALAQNSLNPTERMTTANQAYGEGDFKTAITLYETLHHDGFRHSNLYYNLGNAYYQQGDWGRAILNYRRAQGLAPRDSDIRTNLAIARSRTQDRLSESPETVVLIFAYLTERWLTVEEGQWLALIVWSVGCLSLSLALVWTRVARFGRGLMGISLAVLCLLGISLASRFYLEWRYPSAVLVATTIEVTSGPGASDRYPKQFILHAGADARVLEQEGGWVHLSFPNNLDGWVSVQDVARVYE